MPQKKAKQVQFLSDLFALAGTSTKLAAALNLHAYTVENWRRAGVPRKHWDKLHELYGVTPAELHLLSKNCRKAVKSPSKLKKR